VIALTKQDYANLLGFLDRTTATGVDEFKTVSLLVFKLEYLIEQANAPQLPPPAAKEAPAPQTESNVVPLNRG
jgi:hypothetical protein